MATEHELTNLRDAITSAQYAADLAKERLDAANTHLAEAKDAYVSAVLETPTSHPTGFQRAELPVPPQQQVLPCCDHREKDPL